MTPETRAAMALVAAGMDPGLVERTLPLVGVEATDTAEQVAGRVEGLAADVPALFGSSAPVPRRSSVGPASSGGGDAAGRSVAELGEEALRVAGLRSRDDVGRRERKARDAGERARERFVGRHGRLPGGDAA